MPRWTPGSECHSDPDERAQWSACPLPPFLQLVGFYVVQDEGQQPSPALRLACPVAWQGLGTTMGRGRCPINLAHQRGGLRCPSPSREEVGGVWGQAEKEAVPAFCPVHVTLMPPGWPCCLLPCRGSPGPKDLLTVPCTASAPPLLPGPAAPPLPVQSPFVFLPVCSIGGPASVWRLRWSSRAAVSLFRALSQPVWAAPKACIRGAPGGNPEAGWL